MPRNATTGERHDLADAARNRNNPAVRRCPAPGSWRAGRAITLRPREDGVLRIAHGGVWATFDGPHVGPLNDLGDRVLGAGEQLRVRRGQRLVLEAVDRAAPAYFSWDFACAGTGPRAALAVAQPWSDLQLAVVLGVRAGVRLVGRRHRAGRAARCCRAPGATSAPPREVRAGARRDNRGMSARHVVVMGVAGCGKSAVGERLAQALGLPLVEGDAFHPARQHRQDAPGPAAGRRRTGPAGCDALGAGTRAPARRARCSPARRSSAATATRLRAAAPGLRFVHLALTPDAGAGAGGRARRTTSIRPAWWPASSQALEDPAGEAGRAWSVDACAAVRAKCWPATRAGCAG